MRRFAQTILLILALCLGAPFVAIAQQPATPAKPSESPTTQRVEPLPGTAQPPSSAAGEAAVPPPVATDASYQLGVGDYIETAVIGQNEFNTRSRIGTDGKVILPLIGAMPATNRTPSQLAEEIRLALKNGSFYANPVVRVDVIGVASRIVTILGAVGAPGLMPLDREYHLSQIIARVGGSNGAGADYVVLTSSEGVSKRYKLADLAIATGDQDPIVKSGDKIYIPASENLVFYITGQVRNAGSFPVTENMTVRMAIAKAGGLTETGSEKKVKINRKGEKLKNVKIDGTIVEPGDILTVGERLF